MQLFFDRMIFDSYFCYFEIAVIWNFERLILNKKTKL